MSGLVGINGKYYKAASIVQNVPMAITHKQVSIDGNTYNVSEIEETLRPLIKVGTYFTVRDGGTLVQLVKVSGDEIRAVSVREGNRWSDRYISREAAIVESHGTYITHAQLETLMGRDDFHSFKTFDDLGKSNV